MMFRAEIKTYFLPTLVWNCQATQDQLNHVSMCDTHSDSEHRHLYYDMVLYVLFPRCLRHKEHSAVLKLGVGAEIFIRVFR